MIEPSIVTKTDLEQEVIYVSVNNLSRRINIRCNLKDMPFYWRCIAELVGYGANMEYKQQMKSKGNIVVPQTIVKGGVIH